MYRSSPSCCLYLAKWGREHYSPYAGRRCGRQKGSAKTPFLHKVLSEFSYGSRALHWNLRFEVVGMIL